MGIGVLAGAVYALFGRMTLTLNPGRGELFRGVGDMGRRQKFLLAKDARIVTNGNYVAIVIAGIANPDYAPIDTALETALNF